MMRMENRNKEKENKHGIFILCSIPRNALSTFFLHTKSREENISKIL